MATQVSEILSSKSIREGNGRFDGTRVFRVYNDQNEILSPKDVVDLFGSGTLPLVGDEWPDITGVYAKSYDVKPIDGSSGIWEVTFAYTNTEYTGAGPQQVGYTDFSVDFSSEFRDTWRVPPSLFIPANGDVGNTAATAGCNGAAIDSAGIPASVLGRKAAIQFTETVALSSIDARLGVIGYSVGKRNAGPFKGFPTGSVLYLGAQASRIEQDRASVTHRFQYDQFFHMIQMPHRGPDGQPLLMEISGVLVAESVWWRQPFPTKMDFNSLSENF